MTLQEYSRKRRKKKTPEPEAKKAYSSKAIFVIQKHFAKKLHYDFRIAHKGVLKSWAVPKGISKKINEKRLAIQTEDHPMAYASFEGTIPKGEYGAGEVIIWDKGRYENLKRLKSGKKETLSTSFKKGLIEIYLEGKKVSGGYALIHFREKNWFIMKMKSSTVKSLLQGGKEK